MQGQELDFSDTCGSLPVHGILRFYDFRSYKKIEVKQLAK